MAKGPEPHEPLPSRPPQDTTVEANPYHRPSALRWQILFRFVHEEDRNAAARSMLIWEEWLARHHQWGPGEYDYGPAIYNRLESVVADLMACARDLAWIGTFEVAQPSFQDKLWLPKCPEWAEAAAEVARAIRHALNGPPAVFDYPAVFRNPE